MREHSINLTTVLFVCGVFLMTTIGCRLGDRGGSDDKGFPGSQRGSSGGAGQSGTAGSSKGNAKQGLIGRWKSTEAVVEFISDRAMTINNVRYNYSISGANLVVVGNDGQVEIPYELDGDQLTVTVQGRKVYYSRISGNEATNGRNDSGGSGTNPPELVGRWNYSSSFTAVNGGASQADTFFVLNADGTYLYRSDRSSSNPNGGTSSQTNDSGRWSATETTLTAQSNNGQTYTYTLEKRNHPKTGDPMLMVDGKAYVTATQRAPW